jgi:hypothetical protein
MFSSIKRSSALATRFDFSKQWLHGFVSGPEKATDKAIDDFLIDRLGLKNVSGPILGSLSDPELKATMHDLKRSMDDLNKTSLTALIVLTLSPLPVEI